MLSARFECQALAPEMKRRGGLRPPERMPHIRAANSGLHCGPEGRLRRPRGSCEATACYSFSLYFQAVSKTRLRQFEQTRLLNFMTLKTSLPRQKIE